jgi:hypothetical protein
MGARITRDGLSSISRAALLAAALSTYLVSPDDVVWRFIKGAPHARLLEHAAFATAAAMLGIALVLKMRASAYAGEQGIYDPNRTRAVASNLFQAVGIGSLLPLPGFLLLVVGDLGISLLLRGRRPVPEEPTAAGPDSRHLSQARWRHALATHIGLCCAFISMLFFSIVLVDRVADALFATTALISVAASSRGALRVRRSPS